MTSTLVLSLLMATPVVVAWLSARLLREDVDLPVAGVADTFRAARARHDRRVLGALVTGHRDRVRLPVLPDPFGVPVVRAGLACLVPLEQVVGSVDGGRHPFDRYFDPTDDSARARFGAVLAARLAGVELPPVELRHWRDGYFVVDGHHRVAVARALGDTDIRADVTWLQDAG
jgi:hypothetical protein